MQGNEDSFRGMTSARTETPVKHIQPPLSPKGSPIHTQTPKRHADYPASISNEVPKKDIEWLTKGKDQSCAGL